LKVLRSSGIERPKTLGRVAQIILLVMSSLMLLMPGVSQANSGGLSGYHGYPSNADATTCRSSGCHDAGVYTATINLGGPTTLAHKATSTTDFTLSGTGGIRRGFNLAIYRGAAKQTSTFSSMSTGVQVSNNELVHDGVQDTGSWSYRWTAPATLGTYRIYACLNPVDFTGGSDGDGAAACTTRDITVFNNPPNAADNLIAITVSEDATAYSANVNMLTNDSETETDAFAWLSHSVGSIQGDLNRVSGGTYRYRPGGAFESLDTGDTATESFTYTIRETGYTGATECNGGPCTDTATVSIRVTGVNDAPVAVDNTVSVDIAGTATTVVEGNSSSVLTNDTDPDAGEAVKQAFLLTPPSNHDAAGMGAFTLNTDGTFSYTHDGSAVLSDSFTYRVSDGTTFSGSATVTITISNTAPTAVADPLVATVLEGGSVNFTVLGNDTDDETSATAVVNITNEIGGTATVQPNQSVTFVHNGTEDPASFRYQASDGFLTSVGNALVTLNVTPVNDPPVMGTVNNFSAVEGNLINLNPGVTDPDDPNNGSGALTWSISSGLVVGMAISPTGDFTWTPPLGTAPTPAVFNDMYPVTIRVQDDTPGSVADTESFTITVNPPDADSDMVADYNDFCPTVADGSNADFDGDGTRGSDLNPSDSFGGDACDADDDNDGMPDSFESANSFDPFNDADAGADADNDGITNLQEFLDSTNPNQANLAIDATGYLTAYDLVPPEPTSIHTLATAVTPQFSALITPVSTDPNGPYRPGNNTIEWVPSNADNPDLRGVAGLITDPPTQPFLIRPLASFGVNQQVEENAAVIVTVRLNGDSPSWMVTPPAVATPAIVNYTVAGTASAPDDHNAVSGSVQFNPGEYSKDISFNTATDGVMDPNETVVFTLMSATNAAIGVKKTHTVTIVEDNIAPRAALQFSQGGSAVGATFDNSPITIDAMPSDANGAQALSCNWSGTDNALMPPGIVADCKASPNWTVISPVAGNYRIEVVVTDNGSPAKSTRVSRILHVAVPPLPAEMLSAANDSDMDGIDDLAEGYADLDGDGIPAYLDDINGTVAGANLIPDQTVDMSQLLLLETEPGLTLRRGSTTQAANIFGALVSDSNVAQSGGPGGGAPLNSADSFEHVGGIYDFEIDGMIPGSSVNIVIPLQSAIPQHARYRKFNPATGWSDFVVDANNLIASASGELGACPEPGSSAYSSGLNYLDNCIQLTIQDGGLNDTDNSANGVINDPSTVGVELRDPEGFDEVEDGSGGGRMSPLMLTILLVFGGFAFWRRRRGFGID